jgi:hypothetical protein
MKFFDFEFGFNPGSIALGAAVYFFSPIVAPMAIRAIRAVAKSGIKGGMVLYDTGKKTVAGTMNYVQEIANEAKKEVVH